MNEWPLWSAVISRSRRRIDTPAALLLRCGEFQLLNLKMIWTSRFVHRCSFAFAWPPV
jgi:hypothetical protein